MNKLDGFVLALLNRVLYAQSRGIKQFRLRHPAGDTLFVHMPAHPGGQITVIRAVGKEKTKLTLTTSVKELQWDLANGMTSELSVELRG